MFKANGRFRAVALVIGLLLTNVSDPPLIAQTTQVPGAPKLLLITILDGEDALNNIKQRTAREPIVQVEDENHKPVAGATVVFLLPHSGASGSFLDGTQSYTTTTDVNGKAIGRGLRPNKVTGKFQIQVKANYKDASSAATVASESIIINQTNSSESSAVAQHASHAIPTKVIVIVAAAAVAGGITAGVLLSRTSSPSTITAGTPTVGAPSARR
jgi:hypothetical protein